jgi:3',5'-nucleoside bisphosphate phosphatase
MIVRADFHTHSCLSPCGDLSMSPKTIARLLSGRGVALAALTDHNSALNLPAFGAACRETGIVPLFGIEAQGQEECHVLCLFSSLDAALELGEELYRLMPDVMNIPEKTGDQVYVDENEDIAGEVDKYLITSADIGLDDLARRVIGLGGIVIPAHVDRPAFSLTSQLGFIPDGPWAALEVTRMPTGDEPSGATHDARAVDTRGYPLITSSDAHYPEHVARRAFDLDLADAPLVDESGNANLATIVAALERRPR